MDLAIPELDLGFFSVKKLLCDLWFHTVPGGNAEGTGSASRR